MKLHSVLLMYLGRRAVVPALVGAAMLAGYELLPSAPLTGLEGVPILIVLADAVWLSVALSRLNKGEMAFLYTRGFRWDTLWWHRVFIGALSALLVIAAAFMVLWLGLRTAAQIGMGNTLYPLVARRETWVPLTWLGLYSLALPVGLYEFVRSEKQSPLGGICLAFAVIVAAIAAMNCPMAVNAWLRSLLLALGACGVASLLWAGKRLHRDVEVTA